MTLNAIFAGYEATRPARRSWLRRHYVTEFGLTPGTLLDVGCGSGFWSDLFRDEGFTVTAFDHRPDLIERAKTKYPGIAFSVADATLPFRFLPNTFDVVFARTLPHFWQEDLEPATDLVANLLRHVHGTLLVSIYSVGDDVDRPMLVGGTARHHRDAALVAAVQDAGGRYVRSVRVGKYLQIASY